MKYNNPYDYYYYDDRYDKKAERALKNCFWCTISFVIIIALMLAFSSCRSVQYVPVEKVITEYKTNTVHDSVYLEVLKHDSVVVEKLGDTVVINKWHTQYQDRWKEIIKIDTVIKVDSIQVPYPVERELSKWEETKMDMGGIAIGVCICFIILSVIGVLVKVNRRS